MQIKNIIRSLFFLLIANFLPACKKQLAVDVPIYTTNEVIIYESDVTAVSVLAGLYIKMASSNLWSLSAYASLSADELAPYPAIANLITATGYYKNALNTTNTGEIDYWNINYPLIYYSNAAIGGLTKSIHLSPAIKNQLLGEAKFIRAICYFYMVNLYGDIPLTTSTDYNKNRLLARSPKEEVWQLIIDDLKEAQNLLSNDYFDGTITQISSERVRLTKWAATALLARAYLYKEKFAEAEKEASKVIANSTVFSLPAPDINFIKNNGEAIWQLQPVNYGENTTDAKWFVIPSTGFTSVQPFYITEDLIAQFELGDQRKTFWTNSITVGATTYYYPYKYKVNLANQPITEQNTILRLGEQYLIRAEARIKQNNVSGGIEDINKVRERARASITVDIPNPLPPLLDTLTQSQALTALYHERRVELFTEWGHRWLDLKRTGMVDVVMEQVTAQKGGTWSPNWAYYPIPLTDLQSDPNLKQNDGYN
jgi:hypothetical protein